MPPPDGIRPPRHPRSRTLQEAVSFRFQRLPDTAFQPTRRRTPALDDPGNGGKAVSRGWWHSAHPHQSYRRSEKLPAIPPELGMHG